QIMGQAVKHFSQPQELIEEERKQHQDDDLTKLPSPLLSQLPREILLYNIFSYLTYLDLCHLSQINKYFKNLIESKDVDHLRRQANKTKMLAESYEVKYLDVDRIVTIGVRSGEYDYIGNVQEKIYHSFGNLTELLPKNQILRLSDNGKPLIYSASFLSYKDRIDNNQAIITVQSINADASADNIRKFDFNWFAGQAL
ncbi:unnamed protein product, partial [Didymodactylos carnosus]